MCAAYSGRLPTRYVIMDIEAGIDTSAHTVGHAHKRGNFVPSPSAPPARACRALLSADTETGDTKRPFITSNMIHSTRDTSHVTATAQPRHCTVVSDWSPGYKICDIGLLEPRSLYPLIQRQDALREESLLSLYVRCLQWSPAYKIRDNGH